MPDNAERGPKNVRRCVAVELVLMATKAEAINTVALSNIKIQPWQEKFERMSVVDFAETKIFATLYVSDVFDCVGLSFSYLSNTAGMVADRSAAQR